LWFNLTGTIKQYALN